jgi:hypothetical protein
MVCDIPDRDGKIANLFYSVGVQIKLPCKSYTFIICSLYSAHDARSHATSAIAAPSAFTGLPLVVQPLLLVSHCTPTFCVVYLFTLQHLSLTMPLLLTVLHFLLDILYHVLTVQSLLLAV